MTSPRNLLLIALLFLGYLLWNAWQEDYSHAPRRRPPQRRRASAGRRRAGSARERRSAERDARRRATPAAPDAPRRRRADDDQRRQRRTSSSRPTCCASRSIRTAATSSSPICSRIRSSRRTTRIRCACSTTAPRTSSKRRAAWSARSAAPDHTATFTRRENRLHARRRRRQHRSAADLDRSRPASSVRKVFVFKRAQLRDRAAPGNHQQERRAAGTATPTASCSACRRSSTRSGIKAYSNTERYSFIGAAWYNASDKFQKLKFDNFAKEPLNKSFAGGWAAMLQHYFFAAWIPDRGRESINTRPRSCRAPTRRAI